MNADELEGYPEGTDADLGDLDDITFDDAPPQVKPTVAVKAPKAPRAPKAPPLNVLASNKAINDSAVAPKPKKTRKRKVAKTKKQHRVETIDSNKLASYLDKIVNDEGYQLISVTGSSSMMGMFTVVSVKG
jgi:hypothetical protein